MKKKFLSIFLAPLFVVPIALSSCSSQTIDNSSQQFFVYKSQNYQLEIHPYYDPSVNNGVCTMADISVVFNHPDTAQIDQQIYIDSLTINDSYTNPDNGYTYKTNIVTFCNDKNKVLKDDGYDAYVEYVIGNFSVNANFFIPHILLNPDDEMDDSSYLIWDSDSKIPGYFWNYDDTNKYVPNVSIRSTYMDIVNFSVYNFDCEFDGPLTFSNKIIYFKGLSQYNITPDTNITLPNSIKTISSEAFDRCTFYQSTFTIPQSVETIGDNAFANLYAPSSGSTTTTTKNVIKVPSKFESDAERIFGTKPDDSSSSSSSSSTSSNQDDLPNTWTNYDIQFY